MAVFTNLNVSIALYSQKVRADLWKSGGHIPNFVVGAASFLSMFYLAENKHVICLVKAALLESNLLSISNGSLSSRV
jgi:hypothetical protein